MKRLKHVLKLFIVITFVIVAFSLTQKKATFAGSSDTDFAGKEDYYYDLCSSSGLSSSDKETCTQFRDYLQKKQDAIDDEMDELMKNIKVIKANIKNEGQKIERYNNQIENLETQIVSINKSIKKVEGNIENLSVQISERETKITNLDNQVKNIIVVSQANARSHNYIKFVMGADSFVDILRRINALNEIAEFNQRKIEEIQSEKELLQQDLDDLQQQKDFLAQQKTDLKSKQKSLEKLKEITEELIREYEDHQAELIEEWDSLEEDYSDLDAVIKDINKALKSFSASKNWGQFVKNKRFRISSACYYYRGEKGPGGFHAAIDVANLGFGSPIYSVANGYVFKTGTGCAYNGGYLGNSCNQGRGNYVMMVVQVEKKYYSVYYEHLKDVYVKAGQVVNKGTSIGTSGNSGDSSGPHLHLGIYYQGTTSSTTIPKIVNLFRSKGTRFGLKYNYKGSCEYRNWEAPCFENPMYIYGYFYNHWYTVGNW